jgi:hypothetical protein
MMRILRPLDRRGFGAGAGRAAIVLSGGLALGLLALSSSAESPAAAAAQAPAAAQPQTARDMSHLYHDTVHDCGGATQPAFLCSGIILRATKPGAGYYSWQPSPASQQSLGVSFSYIRADAKFDTFVHGEANGFTLYPIQGNLRAPAAKQALKVLCAFPLDAWTDYRADQGCGGDATFPRQSVPCQQQNILTAEQWIAHYKAAPSQPYYYQCGFDVGDRSPATAQAFYQNLRAMKMLGTTSFNQQNELRLLTWPKGWAKELPIQSFFYVGGGQALANARKDQTDYYNVTHEFVPVIQMTVPRKPAEDFDFHFNPQDQAVPSPS